MKQKLLIKKFIEFAAQDKFFEKEGNKWCVRCALGNAADDFVEEFSLPTMPLSILLAQYNTGEYSETEYDEISIKARDYLASINFDLLFSSKKLAKDFMLKVAKNL